MKRLMAFLIFALLVFIDGCGPDQYEWQNASKSNSLSAYKRFLRLFPDSSFADEATKRIVSTSNIRNIFVSEEASAREPGLSFIRTAQEVLRSRGFVVSQEQQESDGILKIRISSESFTRDYVNQYGRTTVGLTSYHEDGYEIFGTVLIESLRFPSVGPIRFRVRIEPPRQITSSVTTLDAYEKQIEQNAIFRHRQAILYSEDTFRKALIKLIEKTKSGISSINKSAIDEFYDNEIEEIFVR
jgi:hypothetical protein